MGDGSSTNPWDLQTALGHPSVVQPGDRIWIRGGVYNGKFTSHLSGSSAAPITVCSYPGEWAVLDGYKTATLSQSLTAASGGSESTVVLTSKVLAGTVLRIDDEQLNLYNFLGNNTYTAVRGWNGTVASAHGAGAPGVVVGTVLEVSGNDAVFRDFEVTNTYPVRIDLVNSNNNYTLLSTTRGAGISVHGARVKILNTIVHDTLDGIDAWSQAPDSEITGNIIYNCGIEGADRGHGHALYQENAQGTRLVKDNIQLNSFDLGAQFYGVTGPFVGGHIEGNVNFNSGSPYHKSAAVRSRNMLVGTDSQSIPSVEIKDNYFYQPQGLNASDLSMGYGTIQNDSATLTGNYITAGFDVNRWARVTFTDNTIAQYNPGGNTISNMTSLNDPNAVSIQWDNNRYFDLSRLVNCVGGSLRANFGIPGVSGACGGMLLFSEWQSRGLDVHSQYSNTKAPNAIFVRQNPYDAKRAHIVVYNWEKSPSVMVDLSFVPVGSAIEIRSSQNIFGMPTYEGVYQGGSVSLSMQDLNVAAPIGYGYTPASTAPEFNAFLLFIH